MKKKNLKILLATSAIFVMVFSVFTSFAAEAEEPYRTEEKDVVITDNDVVIDYNVEGNLVVFANNVTVKEGKEIRGDAVIFANSVTFEPNSYVLSNLVVASNTLDLKGTTYTLYAAVNSVNVEGYVYRDMKVCAGGKVSILGTVGRDSTIVGTSDITFKANEEDEATKGLVAGKLTYYSQKEATSDFGNSVDKEKVTHIAIAPVSANTSVADKVLHFISSLINSLIVLAVLALAFTKLTPKFVETAEKTFSERRYSNILLGLGLAVLVPIITFALLFTVVGVNLALLAFVIYLLLIYLATPVFLIGLTGVVSNRLNVETIGKKILVLFGLATILSLVKLVPTLGAIVSILVGLVGLGIIVTHVIGLLKVGNTSTPATKLATVTDSKAEVVAKAETKTTANKTTPKKTATKSTTKTSATKNAPTVAKASTTKKAPATKKANTTTKKSATPAKKVASTTTKKTTAKKASGTAKKTTAAKKTNTKKK